MTTPAAWRPRPGLALFGACLLLAAIALALPVNHDEGQYAAPAVLALDHRPFADFIYLQTPLQLYLSAAIAPLTPSWTFVALRLVNAAMGAGALALVYAAQRRLGVPRGRAIAACGLLLTCYPFQFSCAVARNDALPLLLEAGAMLAAIVAVDGARRPWALWTFAGLCLGAAASAKISYALPLAAMGLVVLVGFVRRRSSLASVIGYGAGGGLGLLPCLLAWLQAPQAFVWGVFTYAGTAPIRWYTEVGEGGRLGLAGRLGEGAFHLMVGPGLAVLITVAVAIFAAYRARTAQGPAMRLLQVLALAGLAAALAPTPMQRQYFMPLLPPLFALWGLQGRLGEGVHPLPRRLLACLTVAGLLIGIGRSLYVLGAAAVGLVQGRLPPPLQLEADAHWIGRTMRAAHAAGPIATPSPQVALDSGQPLDPRLSTGVFAYRTGDLVSDADQRRLHLISPRTLGRFLDAAPPAAIVTGYEPVTGRFHRNVDDDFRAYAKTRGYRLLVGPDGRAQLYVRAPGQDFMAPSAGPPPAPVPSRRPGP